MGAKYICKVTVLCERTNQAAVCSLNRSADRMDAAVPSQDSVLMLGIVSVSPCMLVLENPVAAPQEGAGSLIVGGVFIEFTQQYLGPPSPPPTQLLCWLRDAISDNLLKVSASLGTYANT